MAETEVRMELPWCPFAFLFPLSLFWSAQILVIVAHESAWELTLFVNAVFAAKWHCAFSSAQIPLSWFELLWQVPGTWYEILEKTPRTGQKVNVYVHSGQSAQRKTSVGGDSATPQVVLPGWISSVVEGGLERWISDKGHCDNQREVLYKQNPFQWMGLLNAQQKIKGKVWKFWGLSGRMLPRFSGVCSCRCVTLMCVCIECAQALGVLLKWDIGIFSCFQTLKGDQEFCWWYGSGFGEGEGSCWIWSVCQLIFRSHMVQEEVQTLKAPPEPVANKISVSTASKPMEQSLGLILMKAFKEALPIVFKRNVEISGGLDCLLFSSC